MNNELLSLPERMVLESLSRRGKSKCELQMDLEIREQMLVLVLMQLSRKKLILEFKGTYEIDNHKFKEWKDKNGLGEGGKGELVELINACVFDSFQKRKSGRSFVDSSFSLRKIWMNEGEKERLDEIMDRMDRLLKDISLKQAERMLDKKTVEQKIIYWGTAPYGEVFRYLINNV